MSLSSNESKDNADTNPARVCMCVYVCVCVCVCVCVRACVSPCTRRSDERAAAVGGGLSREQNSHSPWTRFSTTREQANRERHSSDHTGRAEPKRSDAKRREATRRDANGRRRAAPQYLSTHLEPRGLFDPVVALEDGRAHGRLARQLGRRDRLALVRVRLVRPPLERVEPRKIVVVQVRRARDRADLASARARERWSLIAWEGTPAGASEGRKGGGASTATGAAPRHRHHMHRLHASTEHQNQSSCCPCALRKAGFCPSW